MIFKNMSFSWGLISDFPKFSMILSFSWEFKIFFFNKLNINSFDLKKTSFFFLYISNIFTFWANLMPVIFLIISTSSFSIVEYLNDFCDKKSFNVAFSFAIEKYELTESKKLNKISLIDSCLDEFNLLKNFNSSNCLQLLFNKSNTLIKYWELFNFNNNSQSKSIIIFSWFSKDFGSSFFSLLSLFSFSFTSWVFSIFFFSSFLSWLIIFSCSNLILFIFNSSFSFFNISSFSLTSLIYISILLLFSSIFLIFSFNSSIFLFFSLIIKSFSPIFFSTFIFSSSKPSIFFCSKKIWLFKFFLSNSNCLIFSSFDDSSLFNSEFFFSSSSIFSFISFSFFRIWLFNSAITLLPNSSCFGWGFDIFDFNCLISSSFCMFNFSNLAIFSFIILWSFSIWSCIDNIEASNDFWISSALKDILFNS